PSACGELGTCTAATVGMLEITPTSADRSRMQLRMSPSHPCQATGTGIVDRKVESLPRRSAKPCSRAAFSLRESGWCSAHRLGRVTAPHVGKPCEKAPCPRLALACRSVGNDRGLSTRSENLPPWDSPCSRTRAGGGLRLASSCDGS